MRKIVTAFILVPLAIVMIIFAVANREIVAISFDPFDSAQPAFALKLPLFILIIALIGIGVVIGGVTTWLKQYKWRARTRRAEAEARALRAELAERKWPFDERSSLPAPRDPPASIIFPPAA